MSYRLDGDTVTLTMTRDDYDSVLLALGMATGVANRENTGLIYRWLSLVNRINEGNPNFTPYEIPPEDTPV